ncbi:MAG: GDSL-type esterase/lipase family protein [Planctomycetota bacterium]|nr:GDSL-type esterase/lipase family protein [Planctomycetota bacterium]
MSDYPEGTGLKTEIHARSSSLAVFVCAACGGSAVGWYIYDAYRHLGVISGQHLLVIVIAAAWAVSALIGFWAPRRVAASRPSTQKYEPINRLAARVNRLASVGLLPLLVWHISQAYWAAIYGARPVPAGYRLLLIFALMLAVLVICASVLRRLLGSRRAMGPVVSLGMAAVLLFITEAVWSAMSVPFPGPRNFAVDGGFISRTVDESVTGYPYIYRSKVRYREEWGSNPRGYFDDRNGLDYSINNLGLRGRQPSPPETVGVYRVVFLGDSFTFGAGVRESDTLPEQVGRGLRALCDDCPIECVNGGVSGFDTRQEVALYRDLLMPYEPDAVVVVMGLNDRRPTSVNSTITWQPSELERVSVLFSRVRVAVAGWVVHDVAHELPSYETCFTALRDLRDLLGPDQRLLVAIYPYVDDRLWNYPLKDLHRQIAERLADDGIAVIDLLPVLLALGSAELCVHNQQDNHPNEVAHAAAGQAIAKRLGNSLIARRRTAKMAFAPDGQ